MADEKISQLPVGTTITGAELVEVVQNGQNVQVPAGSVRGVSVGKSMNSAYTASIANPTTLTWKLQRLYRAGFEPIAPRMQTFLDSCVQDFGYYVRSGNIGTWSFANGQLSAASTANSFGNAQVLVGYETFEQSSFSIAIEGVTNTPDTGANALAVGIQKNSSNMLYAYYEIGSGTQNRITIAKTVAGVFTIVTQTAIGSLPAGISGLACTYEGNGMTVWIQVGNNVAWVPVLSTTITDFNLLSATELKQWHPMIQVTGGATTPWKISRIRTGYSGSGLAFRDFKVVSNRDGTPYISNGFMYFTASNSLCNIWRMNVKTGFMEKVGVLLFNRGGTIFADLNAHIVWDSTVNTWRVFFASWAAGLNNGVQLYYGTYNGDLLEGVHVITGTHVNVTQASGNAVYDQCLVYDAANTRWLLSYAVSPGGTFGGNMHIALDTSPDLVNWSSLWYDTADSNYEGSNISAIGGKYYVFGSNGTNFRVWNTSSGVSLGIMSVDTFPPTAGNPPPHFIVFSWMDADTTQYYALSWSNVQTVFNGGGTFSTGTPMLYKADQTEVGFQFPLIGAI